MIIRKSLALVGAITVAMVGFAAPASAQATRTWVSGVGDDVNPCSRTAPCKTFAGAISKTATGGEINALDPGGFGTINITKHMTLDGYGPMTSLLAANVNGVIVNGAGVIVTLRNLTINGAGNAPNNVNGNGIRILQASSVNIDNVVIEHFSGTGSNGKGIDIATATANVRVNVQDTKIHNMNNFGVHGNPSAGNVILWMDNVSITKGNTTAVQLRQNITASLNEVSITGHNPGAAVAAELTSVTTHISNSFFANNGFGIFSGNGGAPTTRVYGTVITGSATDGINATGGGSVLTYGNNAVRGNNGNEAFTAASLGTQ
jgi:hypothetical protein